MLFSNWAVVQYLNANYECAWQSLRPVPKVHIDFGNGHTLDRTLHGNIAFWFVTAQGEAFDLLPGLVDAGTFLARCRETLVLSTSLIAASDPDLRRRIVAEAHTKRIAPPTLSALASVPDISKRRVEQRVEAALDVGNQDARNHAITLDRVITPADFSKLAVEVPLKSSLLSVHTQLPIADASGLPVDTAFNQRVRFPQADRLMAESPLEKPAALTQRAYREILGVDLADPYLGLAPYLLGGEPGRDAAGVGAH